MKIIEISSEEILDKKLKVHYLKEPNVIESFPIGNIWDGFTI